MKALAYKLYVAYFFGVYTSNFLILEHFYDGQSVASISKVNFFLVFCILERKKKDLEIVSRMP